MPHQVHSTYYFMGFYTTGSIMDLECPSKFKTHCAQVPRFYSASTGFKDIIRSPAASPLIRLRGSTNSISQVICLAHYEVYHSGPDRIACLSTLFPLMHTKFCIERLQNQKLKCHASSHVNNTKILLG